MRRSGRFVAVRPPQCLDGSRVPDKEGERPLAVSVPHRKLVFVDDQHPGIRRRLLRGRWAYFDAGGARIVDRDEIDRLNQIGLPPAYEQAWFSPDPNAHIQATGIDARGRKQYRYHPDFTADRDASKFGRCVAFGEALPLIRARVEHDLAKRGLSRERALASVVRLLDTGRIRARQRSLCPRQRQLRRDNAAHASCSGWIMAS